MTQKLLSIIIPSYNMELLLPRCLNSVLSIPLVENIEVIIVNDGSKDRTIDIAQKYKKQYNNSVVIIDKQNGNYGSCINSGLTVASGKYIKILDADDYVNTNNLNSFVTSLIRLKEYIDLIITPFNFIYEKTNEIKEVKYSSEKDLAILKDSQNIARITKLFFGNVKISMHAFTYRTSLIKNINYIQSEGIPYTDQEWIFYPISYIRNILFLDHNVYQYCIGREGQSMEITSLIKNSTHLIHIISKMLPFYIENKLHKNENMFFIKYAENLLSFQLENIYRTILLRSDDSFYKKNNCSLYELDKQIQDSDLSLYHNLNSSIIHKYIPIKFIKYWRKDKKKRIPYWITKAIFGLKKY